MFLLVVVLWGGVDFRDTAVDRNQAQHKDGSDSADVRVQKLKAKYETVSLYGDEVIPPDAEPDSVDSGHGNHDNDANSLHRHRRAATNHVIELSFVVDFADWTKWTMFYPTNTLVQLKLWYTYVAELINIRYQSIQDPDISIRTKVTNIRILTNDIDDDFIQSLTSNGKFGGEAGLSSFAAWCRGVGNIPKSDHYMLFTGFDINNAAGIAYSGRTCTDLGVSITENSFDGTVGGVAAHELGHSLSASHDAETSSVCTDDNQFIMSTVFQTPVRAGNAGNPWKFSQCSIKAFKNYLSTQTCTYPLKSQVLTFYLPLGTVNGPEVLSRDAQCRLNFRDNSSTYCNVGISLDIFYFTT
ncbi:hypothetical protein Btru_067778 [Bulinus truncatus]|nr:hypothetical protein Btru_067778 [Bulinus truncatus]